MSNTLSGSKIVELLKALQMSEGEKKVWAQLVPYMDEADLLEFQNILEKEHRALHNLSSEYAEQVEKIMKKAKIKAAKQELNGS